MRRVLLSILLLVVIAIPVNAMEFTAPPVPEDGEVYMPEENQSFAEGLWFVIGSAVDRLLPEIAESAGACVRIVAVILLVTVVDVFPGTSTPVLHLVSTVLIGVILIEPAGTLIRLGADTVVEMTEYAKLLLPVLTGALAAQGGASASVTLYAGTAFFSTVLSTMISRLILPLLYIYICLIIVNAVTDQPLIKNLSGFIKWLICWGLKIILYVFTGYIGITGVISGAADASAVKAAKLTISAMVPVVGSIISEASETILLSAGMMKNAAGIYGIFATIALFVGPFLKIGVQYLLLKVTAAVCTVFGSKQENKLLEDFSGVMSMVLAMTGTVCLLLLIGVVCFLKGMS